MKTKSPLYILAAVVCLGAFTGSAHAQTTDWTGPLTGGSLNVATNWSNGLPTNGVVGTISNSSTSINIGGTFSGWNLQQYTGTLTRTSNPTFTAGSSYTIHTGGRYSGTSIFALSLTSNLIINGGTFSNSNRIDLNTGSSIVLNSGVFALSGATNVNRVLYFHNGSIYQSGGSLTAGRLDAFGVTNTSYTITGGNASLTNNLASVLPTVMTFGLGSAGSVNFSLAPTIGSSVINFLTDSQVSLTINGYTKSDYESLWSSSNLRLDGGNAGSFDDSFLVTGSTLTAIPEPSTLALLAVSLTSLAIFRRRRRQSN